MTNSDINRLDRIEAIVESNARAIEALTANINQWQQEGQRQRARLFQTMADLANAQANFYQTQAGFYHRLEESDQRQDELSRRQGEIVEIFKLLTQQREQE